MASIRIEAIAVLRCSFPAQILTLVYKALNGLGPEYITDLLEAYMPTRTLRSAGAHLLLEPKTTTRWGAQAFSKAAPVLWNTLPSTIKTAASLANFKIGSLD